MAAATDFHGPFGERRFSYLHAFFGKILCVLAALVASSVADGQILFVNAAATGANNGTNWADAFNSLQEALGDAAASGGAY